MVQLLGNQILLAPQKAKTDHMAQQFHLSRFKPQIIEDRDSDTYLYARFIAALFSVATVETTCVHPQMNE